jgi:hypothetical protein
MAIFLLPMAPLACRKHRLSVTIEASDHFPAHFRQRQIKITDNRGSRDLPRKVVQNSVRLSGCHSKCSIFDHHHDRFLGSHDLPRKNVQNSVLSERESFKCLDF